VRLDSDTYIRTLSRGGRDEHRKPTLANADPAKREQMASSERLAARCKLLRCSARYICPCVPSATTRGHGAAACGLAEEASPAGIWMLLS
jgi:hypothetical protein